MGKICSVCKIEKDIKFFYKSKTTKCGYTPQCKGCLKKYDSSKTKHDWYFNNREKIKERSKRWAFNNKEKIKERCKQYQIKIKYGLSLQEYNDMFEKQNGCCMICGKHQSELKRVLYVDHDHKTGKVRSLLCTYCNSVLGYVNEDSNILRNMIIYLESFD